MTQLRAHRSLAWLVSSFLLSAIPASSQTPPPDPVPVAAPIPPQIDLNLINLPTMMSIARHKPRGARSREAGGT